SLAFSASIIKRIGTKVIWLLNSLTKSAALSVLDFPTVPSRWMTCLLRLCISTSSKSITASVPTPAAAKYCITGLPSPPAPTTRTFALPIFRWPSTPISSINICLLYRLNTSFVSIIFQLPIRIPILHNRLVARLINNLPHFIHTTFVAGFKLFQRLWIHHISSGIGFRCRTHRCSAQRDDMVSEFFILPGRNGNLQIWIPYPIGANQLQQIPIFHDKVGFYDTFGRPQTRKGNRIFRLPIRFLKVIDMQGVEETVYPPIF